MDQGSGAPVVRGAREQDEPALQAVQRLTWAVSTPSPPPPVERPFLSAERRVVVQDVLVAEADGEVVGYLHLRAASPYPSQRHVQTVVGLGVHPERQRRGAGGALLAAAVAEAGRRGATRLTLRVLGSNATALRAYERAGFHVEGVLRGEFVLDGVAVDDVLMARLLP